MNQFPSIGSWCNTPYGKGRIVGQSGTKWRVKLAAPPKHADPEPLVEKQLIKQL